MTTSRSIPSKFFYVSISYNTNEIDMLIELLANSLSRPAFDLDEVLKLIVGLRLDETILAVTKHMPCSPGEVKELEKFVLLKLEPHYASVLNHILKPAQRRAGKAYHLRIMRTAACIESLPNYACKAGVSFIETIRSNTSPASTKLIPPVRRPPKPRDLT